MVFTSKGGNEEMCHVLGSSHTNIFNLGTELLKEKKLHKKRFVHYFLVTSFIIYKVSLKWTLIKSSVLRMVIFPIEKFLQMEINYLLHYLLLESFICLTAFSLKLTLTWKTLTNSIKIYSWMHSRLRRRILNAHISRLCS